MQYLAGKNDNFCYCSDKMKVCQSLVKKTDILTHFRSQANLNNAVIVQKKLIRIITCSSFRAHTEPLMFANKFMSLSNINFYMTCIFLYQCTPLLHLSCTNYCNSLNQRRRWSMTPYCVTGWTEKTKITIFVPWISAFASLKGTWLNSDICNAINNWRSKLTMSLANYR